MEDDTSGIGEFINQINTITKLLTDKEFAESKGVTHEEMQIDCISQLAALKLTNVEEVYIKCEEALTRIGALDFSTPIEVDDSRHVGNYLAHSLNVLMEELAERIFPFQQEVIDRVSDIVVVTNQRGYIQKVNKRFLTLTGFSEADILDKPIKNFLEPSIIQLDFNDGFSLKDIEINFTGKQNAIPVSLNIDEVKGFRNTTLGFTFIATTK